MTISLSATTQGMLEEKLKSGQYHSADEVVHAALEALEEMESHHLPSEIEDAIDRAEDQIERGQVHEWNDVRDQISGRFLGK